jgi:subtilisin family serine protease
MNKRILVISAALAITACGGGGGGGDDDVSEDMVSDGTVSISKSHLDAINADFGFNQSITGSGVTLAIIDSGVNISHAEFAGKTLNANSGSFDDPNYTVQEITDNGYSGNDFADAVRTGGQDDRTGHGTYVTSMVWGENVGVARGADVIALDVYQGTNSNPNGLAAKGTIEDLNGYGTDFANASFTGVDFYENSTFSDERPLYVPLDTHDIGWIVASGNFAQDMTEVFITDPIDCPDGDTRLRCKFIDNATIVDLLAKDSALKDHFLWVGAVKDTDFSRSTFFLAGNVASSSNIPGSDPDIRARWISAPGSDISGAVPTDNTSYRNVTGTSFAAPLVTGAAAMVKSKFPALTNAAVLQVLLDTANDTFTGYDINIHGQGVLDIEAALQIDPNSY